MCARCAFFFLLGILSQIRGATADDEKRVGHVQKNWVQSKVHSKTTGLVGVVKKFAV